MPTRKKLTAAEEEGKIYGKLQVLRFIPAKPGSATRCTAKCLLCGTTKDYFLQRLREGAAKTCGCYRAAKQKTWCKPIKYKLDHFTFKKEAIEAEEFLPERSIKNGPASRSASYQHLYQECLLDPGNYFWQSDHTEQYLQNNQENAEIKERKAQLLEQLVAIIYQYINGREPCQEAGVIRPITERQKVVFMGIVSGKTQTEIAKELNLSQSSITKCIYGAALFWRGREPGKSLKARHGGILPKLQKILELDNEFQELFEEYKSLF